MNLSTWTVADDDTIVREELGYEFLSTNGSDENYAMEAIELSDASALALDEALSEYETAQSIDDDGPVTIPAQEFLRPGDVSAADRYRSVRETDERRTNGLRVWLDTGIGYESTSDPRGNADYGGSVTWFDIGASYDRDFSFGESLFFYGVDLGGALFSLGQNQNGGSGSLLPHVTPYFGLQGQKTVIRADLFYDKTDGQDYFFGNQGRESLAQKGQRSGVRVSGVRLFDYSELTLGFDYSIEDFDSETRLNDRTSWVGDSAWYYQPTMFPKTSAGVGVRLGEFRTDLNPDISFVEPSLRSKYQIGPKTTVDGRVGYMFRGYDGEDSISDNGSVAFAVGADWRATDQFNVRLETYRDYNSSLQSVGQAYDSTGFRIQCGYRLPFWQLNASVTGAYERADYESTITDRSITRSDDYWWVNSALSRHFETSRYFDTSVSLFHNYRDNASSSDDTDFSQNFTGIRMRVQF